MLSAAAVLLATASPWFEAIVERWSEQQGGGGGGRGTAAASPKQDSEASADTDPSTRESSYTEQQPQQQRLCVHMDVGSAEDAGHLEAALKQVGAGWERELPSCGLTAVPPASGRAALRATRCIHCCRAWWLVQLQQQRPPL
jgi:hypothetical protein